jgi:NADH-quinone oxidoreductase subunit K
MEMLSQVPTSFYLILAAVVFAIGAIGVLVRRNALIIFMCVELMMNAANLALIALANQYGQLDGQIFVFMVMAVAAAEVAVGLAIVMALVRHRDTTNVDEIDLLKG